MHNIDKTSTDVMYQQQRVQETNEHTYIPV